MIITQSFVYHLFVFPFNCIMYSATRAQPERDRTVTSSEKLQFLICETGPVKVSRTALAGCGSGRDRIVTRAKNGPEERRPLKTGDASLDSLQQSRLSQHP